MEEIIYNSDGAIDWNANGWPEPNPEHNLNADGFDSTDMPDDIFEIWEYECDDMDIDWSSDY